MPPSRSRPPRKIAPAVVAAAEQLRIQRDRAYATGHAVHGPWADPCTCERPRWEHRGKSFTGGAPARGDDWPACSKYRPDVAERLLSEALDGIDNGFADDLRWADQQDYTPRQRPPGTWSVRPSDANTCRRAIAYRNLDELARVHGGEFDVIQARYVKAPTNKRAARSGTFFHNGYQSIQARRYPWRQIERAMPIKGLDGDNYRADVFDPVTGILQSIKSAGAYRWETTVREGAADDWIDQDALYGVQLEAEGQVITAVDIRVIERADGDDLLFRIPWGDAMRERAERVRARLTGTMTLLDLGVMPERDRTGPTTDALCRMCEHRWECWQTPMADRLKRTPESLMRFGPNPSPNDLTIAEAIKDLVVATKAVTEAEKAKKAIRATLDTLPHGRYADTQIVDGKEPSTNWKAYAEQLIRHYGESDGARPALSDIPVPKTITSTRIGMVPKAQLAREAKAAARPTPQPAAARDADSGTPQESTTTETTQEAS